MEWADRWGEYRPKVERALDTWVPYVNERLGIALGRPEAIPYYPGYHGGRDPPMSIHHLRPDTIQVAADYGFSDFDIFSGIIHELGHIALHQHGMGYVRSMRDKEFHEGVSEHFCHDGLLDIGGLQGLAYVGKERLVNRFGFRFMNREYQVGYNKIKRLRGEGASLKDIVKNWEWFLQEM